MPARFPRVLTYVARSPLRVCDNLVLSGTLLMADRPPRRDLAVYIFFESFALGSALAALGALVHDIDDWQNWVAWATLAFVLFAAGVKWTRIKPTVVEVRVMGYVIFGSAGAILLMGGYWWLAGLYVPPSNATGSHALLNVSRGLPSYTPDPFPPNQNLKIKIEYVDNGSEAARDIYGAGRIFLLQDHSDARQKRAVATFEKGWQPLLAQLRKKSPGQTMQPSRPGQPVDEQDLEAAGPVINEQQRQWIDEGQRIVLVVAAVRYEDSNGEYELQMCRYLQPPIARMDNWAACKWHDGLVKIGSKPSEPPGNQDTNQSR